MSQFESTPDTARDWRDGGGGDGSGVRDRRARGFARIAPRSQKKEADTVLARERNNRPTVDHAAFLHDGRPKSIGCERGPTTDTSGTGVTQSGRGD